MVLTIDTLTVARPDDPPLVERGSDDEAGWYLITFQSAGLGVVLSTEQLDELVSRALGAKLLDPDEEDR